jgi:hypothetical protein
VPLVRHLGCALPISGTALLAAEQVGTVETVIQKATEKF